MTQRKKAASGEGSFRIRSNGRIEYTFRYTDEFEVRRKKSVSGATRRECLKRAALWLESYQESIKGYDDNTSIADILRNKYENDLNANLISESRYRNNITRLKIIENNVIGKVPIAAVEKKDIDAFGRTLTGYVDDSIQVIYAQLRIAFSIAEEEDLIDYNPMTQRIIRRPKSKKKKKKVHALTMDEQRRLEEVMRNTKPPYGSNDYRPQLFIELYSGIRMGEINALKPEDIDLENNVIHVRATISEDINGKTIIKDRTKTISGMRDVPISSKLRPYLEDALSQYKKNKNGLLFCDRNTGEPFCTSKAAASFRTYCKKAKISARGQHALRHTFATRCIEAGVPPVVLKTWLGHSDIHVTLDTYTDVFDSMNREAAGKFDEYIDAL